MFLNMFVCLMLLAMIGVMRVYGNEIEDAKRLEICLNGDWLRCAGDGTSICHDGKWETVRIPEFHADALKGSAWFRLDFIIPDEFGGSDKRILLRFIRVRHYARIFLNGKECGENYGCRAPFEVDITAAAKIGQENRLDVWVHDCSGAYAMQGKVIEDIEIQKRLSTFEEYRKAATISEDVFLISRLNVYVSDVLVIPSVREKALSVRLTIANDSGRDQTFDIANSVFLQQDKVLDLPDQTLSLRSGDTHTLTISILWENPQLWGYPPYGQPTLYHLETRLHTGEGTTIDGLVTRFGFREIWAEGDKIIFNGKPLRVLGYWTPEASGRSVWTWRMLAIQWSGCNAIHNHAEQREPAYYDVADELGLLVWDADFCGGPLGTTRNMSSEPFPEVEMQLTRQYPLWAKAVANHPSVVLLMMGCLLNNNQVAHLAEVYRSADPTRLIHGGGDMARPPMDMAAYASHFEMAESDPIKDIRESYKRIIGPYSSYEGKPVPVINKEIWYNSREPKTDQWKNVPQEEYARATEEAIRYLSTTKVAGFILYSQQAFERYNSPDTALQWPSRSGESQHPTSNLTGGLAWSPEFVNFHDPSSRAFKPLSTAKAMREAAPTYIGHQMPVAGYRRPEVIVSVSSNNRPLSDVYVYAVRIKGAPEKPIGMRTDKNGKAWLALREPGLYKFLCRGANDWQSVELDAPLQPVDMESGGFGEILNTKIEFVSVPK